MAEQVIKPAVSYGTATLIEAIKNQFNNPRIIPWSLYLINIETMIRNQKEVGKVDPEDVAISVIIDCETFARYLVTNYQQYGFAHGESRSVICFYISKYENIDSKYLKDKLPKGTEERCAVRDSIINTVTKLGFPDLSSDNTDVIFAVNECADKQWPHRELVNSLADKYPRISFRNTLLISHVPLDFHLYKVFDNFTVLESYTGSFKHQRDFGNKVFGNSAIPFNKYTHLLLGDKWYLKQQVDDNTKKLIEQKASSENWNILPDKLILKSLLDAQLPISPSVFVEPEI